MNKEAFVLKDGTTIPMESGSSIENIVSVYSGKADVIAVWEKLTDANLKECHTVASDGTVIGNYENLKLSRPEVDEYTNPDGTVTATFHLEKKSDLEIRMDNVEEGQAVQDGALADLGEVVGVLAEGGQA